MAGGQWLLGENHRIIEPGGTSGDCLVQAPCSKQGQLEQFSQCHAQSGLNTVQNGDSTTSLASQFQHSQLIAFLMVFVKFLVFHFEPVALLLGTAESYLALSSLFLPVRYLYTLIRFSWVFSCLG